MSDIGRFFLHSCLLNRISMSKKIEKTVTLESLSWEELSEDLQILMDSAKEAAEKAYAPHSNFLVGAALLLENGEILTGNNQENAAFPVGICAERVVLGYAHANYPHLIPTKIAIAARKKDHGSYSFVTPCGTCRQTICEYEIKFNNPIEIYMLVPNGEVLKASGIDDLLPFKFSDF